MINDFNLKLIKLILLYFKSLKTLAQTGLISYLVNKQIVNTNQVFLTILINKHNNKIMRIQWN